MIRYVAAALALTLIYALALSSFDPLDLLIGLILASSLLFVARRRGFSRRFSPSGDMPHIGDDLNLPGAVRRFFAFFPFVLAVFRETVAGSWRVLLAVLKVKPPREPGLVAVPLGERTPEGIAVSAFVTAFAPGTLLVRVDEEERVMWIHSIDADDPESVCRDQQEFYERYQRKVFP